MSIVKKSFAGIILWVLGWRAGLATPPVPKCIVVGHPHTSTWDFPLFILTIWYLNVPMKWLGKASLFKGPMGVIYRALGGIPVDRSGGKDMVAAVAEVFAQHDELIIGIAPSGTRSYSPHWRSGFYHMAIAAKVPIVLGTIDYRRRVATFIATTHISGDIHADMDKIRAAFLGIEGRNTAQQTPIRLRSELVEE
jgi:hypothetical protein